MKRKPTAENFAVGDVVYYESPYSNAIAEVVDINHDEVWCDDLATGGIEDFHWWDFAKYFSLLASPLALAKRYCGYVEPKASA